MKFPILTLFFFAGLVQCFGQAPLNPTNTKALVVLEDPEGLGMGQGIIFTSEKRNVSVTFCGEVNAQAIRPGNYQVSLAINNHVTVVDECGDVQHGTEVTITPGARLKFKIIRFR